MACLLICVSARATAQCPARNPEAFPSPEQGDHNRGEPLLPESGLLTDDTYTNLYFGFSLRLPIGVHGHRLMQPITLPGEHALLAIGFQDGNRYGVLKITAGSHREEDDKRMTPEQAQQREDEIARSKGSPAPVQRLDFTPPPLHLKHVDRHVGEVRGTQYSARIRDYAVRFTIQTNEKSFLEKARDSMTTIRVFCANDGGRLFTTEGKAFAPQGTPTTGPTIPTDVVDEAIRTTPAEHTIPTPAFTKGVLQSRELELSYALPQGWTVLPNPTDLIADDARDEIDRRLSYLWKACTRNWLRASGGNNDQQTLEVRVLDQSCLALPFPASASDSLAAESLAEYLQMLGHFGRIKSNRMVQPGGRLFVLYEGTISEAASGQHFSHRDVQMIAVTRYKKLIFAWTWRSPSPSDLARVAASNLSFGDGRPIAIGPMLIISRNSSRP
jgi:hypothetical protein